MTSIQLFPIITPIAGTINETDVNGDAVYEALRLQFIKTGDEATENFNERAICRTIKQFLISGLSDDAVSGVDSAGAFQFSTNNTGTAFERDGRVYRQYEKFITSCLDVMVGNMQDVYDATAVENVETRQRLIIKMATLRELKLKYTVHEEAMNVLNQLRYLF